MDKEEDVREQVKGIRARLQNAQESVSWDEIRQAIKQMTQNTMSIFDETINSFWTWGNKKAYLQMFRALVQMHGAMAEDLVTLNEYVHKITEAVLLLSGKLEKSEKTTIELEDSLNKLESKFKEPTIKRIAEFFDMVDEQIAKGKKASEEYRV